MAIALVGSIGTVATGTTSVAPTFAQATTSGNLLVAWVATYSANASISDATWSLAVRSNQGALRTEVWYKQNCSASETAPSFTTGSLSSSPSYGVFAEFSGVDKTAALDKTGTGGAGISATSPLVAACSAADSYSGALMVTVGYWALTKAGTATTADTYNNGATPTGNLNNDSTSTQWHYRFAYGITTGNSAADQTSQSNNSKNLNFTSLAISSFSIPRTAVPRHGFVHHNNPGVL